MSGPIILDNNVTGYVVLTNSVQRSRLIITPEFSIYFTTPMPDAFRRFWYWALLGWKWEEVKAS